MVMVAVLSSVFVVVAGPAPQASAHMWEGGWFHVGYYPGTTTRMIRIYDETGRTDWNYPLGTFFRNYWNYWAFWNRDRGVDVPYIDYRQSGGLGGCGNQGHSELDICLGNPAGGAAGITRLWRDGSGHITSGSHVILRDGFNNRQRESLGCHEGGGHGIGLDHNPSTGSCLYSPMSNWPPVFYDGHDDETLRVFYDGHMP
jgi:hypothetical protein